MQTSLLELQQAFRHALISGDDLGIAPWLTTGADNAAGRLQIYRNNSQTNLHNSLKADFPVVEKLVGGEFFAYAANAYIAATPSCSGDVGDYGKSFPGFLPDFPAAVSLPYLADVARLERAWIDAFLAVEAPMADLSDLEAVPVEALGGIRFGFHPAVRLLASRYPVLTIWRANQAEESESGDTPISLDSDGECVLLHRRDAEVELCLLEPAEYLWLTALHSGNNLGEAVEAAFSVQPDFDLSGHLQKHIAQGTFITFDTGAAS
jgi:hypothetical protein